MRFPLHSKKSQWRARLVAASVAAAVAVPAFAGDKHDPYIDHNQSTIESHEHWTWIESDKQARQLNNDAWQRRTQAFNQDRHLIGSDVHAPNHQVIGQLVDIVYLDRGNDQLAGYGLIELRGFMGFGVETKAVPWSAFHNHRKGLYVPYGRHEVAEAPKFDANRADGRMFASIDQHYNDHYPLPGYAPADRIDFNPDVYAVPRDDMNDGNTYIDVQTETDMDVQHDTNRQWLNQSEVTVEQTLTLNEQQREEQVGDGAWWLRNDNQQAAQSNLDAETMRIFRDGLDDQPQQSDVYAIPRQGADRTEQQQQQDTDENTMQ